MGIEPGLEGVNLKKCAECDFVTLLAAKLTKHILDKHNKIAVQDANNNTEYVERHLAGVGSNEHSKEEVKSEEENTSCDENNNKENIKREQDHKWFVHLIKDLVQIQKNEDEQREKEEQARKIAKRRKNNITDEDGGKWWKQMKDNEQLDEDEKEWTE